MYFLHSSLSGVQDTFMTYTVYDDALTLSLVQEACSLLGNISKSLMLCQKLQIIFVHYKKSNCAGMWGVSLHQDVFHRC